MSNTRCNNCMTKWNSGQVPTITLEDGSQGEGCPTCKTDAYLMDINCEYIPFIVLYRIEPILAMTDAPASTLIYARDSDHAEELLVTHVPDANVVWVYQGNSYTAAYSDYWNSGNT
jgi:hypothetical protein